MKSSTVFVLAVSILAFGRLTPSFAQAVPPDVADAPLKAAENVSQMFLEQSAKDRERASKFDAIEMDRELLASLPMYQPVTDHRPKVGDTVQVFMGDRMIIQRFGMVSDCVIPRISWEDTKIGTRGIVKANVPVCKSKKSDKNYIPTYINSISPSGNEFIIPLKLKVSKNGEMELCQSQMGMSMACKESLTDLELEVGAAFVSTEGSLQRTIEYMGKSGDQLRFIYSEFKDGLAREAFNREFEVDMSKGNVVAFKGAVMEILEATNATITYRVVRHFEN